MKDFKQDTYTTFCGTAEEWTDLKKKFDSDEKASVIDLRTVNESGGEKLADLPEVWNYQRIPLTGKTVSEQDVDVFRREQRRHGKLIVVAKTEARGGLLAMADNCRRERTLLPDTEVALLSGAVEEKDLQEWLNQYLTRHQTTDEVGEY